MPADEIEDRVDAEAIGTVLRGALAAMPLRQRDVLLLHAWADLSAAEIAVAADLWDSSLLQRAGLTTRASRTAGAGPSNVRWAYDVSIVPDGVARVRWTFADRAGGPGAVVSAPAFNNLAIAPVSRATAVLLSASWYAADGSVVPTSTEARDQAIAAQQATERRQALAQAELQRVRAPAQLLASFAVFSFESPTGTRTSDGYEIAHPPLSQLPLGLLRPRRQLGDLREVRRVRAPSGLEMWVVPGPNGLCVFETDPPTRLPYGRVERIGGGGCSGSVKHALANGTGVDVGGQQGAVVYGVVPRTVHSVKIQVSASASRTIHPADGVYITQTPFHFG
jgi:hypothetical protein